MTNVRERKIEIHGVAGSAPALAVGASFDVFPLAMYGPLRQVDSQTTHQTRPPAAREISAQRHPKLL